MLLVAHPLCRQIASTMAARMLSGSRVEFTAREMSFRLRSRRDSSLGCATELSMADTVTGPPTANMCRQILLDQAGIRPRIPRLLEMPVEARDVGSPSLRGSFGIESGV